MAGETQSTTEATHAGTEVPTEHHSGPFPPFNSETFASQILWLAITFGLFYWIIKNVAVPRISGILEDRKDRIAGDLSEANRLKEETDEAIAAYEQALAEARAKAHGIAHDTRAKLKADNEARREKAEAELAKKLAAAESQIAEVKSQAMEQIGDIAGETTSALVEALMGKAPTKTDLSKALKSAMD
ncbi:F0F1 ATP synthase subunit B [Roseibium aggregatum]|uniref:ATP synthase subunit b n=1 Tax=Roseibium aggregatum TaxID=187304 RepID=A0A926S7J0_9HYPH|nr:F0F1 ATP synthase subunit B [Roseibium aggregatum]MBD1547567.1 F0F1 ATP synthase subunit B [Roseibium aggregatum]